MDQVLYIDLRQQSLEMIRQHARHVELQEASMATYQESLKSLSSCQALLIGEKVDNPIRLAQEAYVHDKGISILLLTDDSGFARMKQAIQFSPFIGPTVQCISNGIGERMALMVADAIQRTQQRRSFAKIKTSSLAAQPFAPHALEKVRSDFTTKVLEEAPIGAVLISSSDVIFSINNYALSLFRKTEKEVLGTLVTDLFQDEVQAVVRAFLQDGYLSNPKQCFELNGPDGTQYLELSVAPIDRKSASGYKLVILNNITSTVVAQKRTQEHLNELEKVNANLARVNADLDTFIYTASHDLKSPILNIEGLVTSLEEELGPARSAVDAELEHIKRSIMRFKQTVEDLTEISRIQKNFEQQATQVEVPALLNDVRQLLEINETKAELILTAQATHVFFPKQNLTSILYNLVNNAIKYRSPTRTPHIHIKSWREGDDVCISVEDNGLGIPADKKDRVFQLFKRMHSHVQGSGVGLYLVKRIVENNGGMITVESEDGHGSVFLLRLKEFAGARQGNQ